MPNSGPKSQCALGSKSKERGSPTVRITTLSLSLVPKGTSGSGILGMPATRSYKSSSTCFSCSSNASMSSLSRRMASIFPCRAAASFMRPISLLTALRWAFLLSTSRMSVRRCSSSATIWSTMPVSIWRLRKASRMSSGFSRINFKSSMSNLLGMALF